MPTPKDTRQAPGLRTIAGIGWGLCVLCGLLPSARAQLAALPSPAPGVSTSDRWVSALAAVAMAAPPLEPVWWRLVLDGEDVDDGGEPSRIQAHLEAALKAALEERGLRGEEAPDAVPPDWTLQVTLRAGEAGLEADAVVTEPAHHLWARLRGATDRRHAASTPAFPLDVEARSLLGLTAPVPVSALSATALEGALEAEGAPVLDLLVVDMDGDGRQEVVALRPESVTILHGVAPSGVGRRTVVALGHLTSNPARVRRAVGRLLEVGGADAPPWVVAATSEYDGATAVRLEGGEAALVPLRPGDWPLYAVGPGRWVAAPWPTATDVLEGAIRQATMAGERAAVDALLPSGFDLRAYGVMTASSDPWNPHLVHAAYDGALTIRDSQGQQTVLADAGAVAVVDDLDDDGVAEVLTTSTALTGPDVLRLWRVVAGSLRPVWEGEAAAPVTAAAVGDLDGDGRRELLLSTWDGRRSGLIVLRPDGAAR